MRTAFSYDFGCQAKIAELFVRQRQRRSRAIAFFRIQFDRSEQAIASQLVVSIAVVPRTQLVIQLGRISFVGIGLGPPVVVVVVTHPASNKPAASPANTLSLVFTALPSSVSFRSSRLRTRGSLTLPANWPHAASISSPRVLRVVATRPCSRSLF